MDLVTRDIGWSFWPSAGLAYIGFLDIIAILNLVNLEFRDHYGNWSGHWSSFTLWSLFFTWGKFKRWKKKNAGFSPDFFQKS